MNDVTGDSSAPPLGVIETDAFCEGCGFNLHSQKVWRDERLGIPVCRCPECGRHAPANMRTIAVSMWLRRLALVGMIAWGVVVLSFIASVFGLAIGIHAAADEGLNYRVLETVDGQPLDFVWSNGKRDYVLKQPGVVAVGGEASEPPPTPTTVPVEQVVLRRKPAPWLTGDSQEMAATNALYGQPVPMVPALIVGTMFIVPWFICGMLLAAGSWFWPARRRWLWLTLPTLAAVVVACLTVNHDESGYWGLEVRVKHDVPPALFVGVIWLLNMLVMGLGIHVGLRVMRSLLTIFIPPKPRQLFAFLWHCDGKTMPAAPSTTRGV